MKRTPTGGAGEGAHKGQGGLSQVDEALAQETDRSGGSAEDALGLVGGQGLQGGLGPPRAGPAR